MADDLGSVFLSSQGVTIPSQRRYVCYYDKFLRNGPAYTPRQLLLQAIRFETLPFNCSGNCGKGSVNKILEF